MSEAESLIEYLATHDALCPGCGYNLRGLESDQCPECGQIQTLKVLLQNTNRKENSFDISGSDELNRGRYIRSLIAALVFFALAVIVPLALILLVSFRGYSPT